MSKKQLTSDIAFLEEMETTLSEISTDNVHQKDKLATMIGDWKAEKQKELSIITSPCNCRFAMKKKNYDECGNCGGVWSTRAKNN
ncbi:hypothetical protein [Pontibacter sp. H249]|uniref:hypothetical protein n=1 Tax=Pontibacter sp. H249 TaxID=3133420 RepID=UPI0030BF43FD